MQDSPSRSELLDRALGLPKIPLFLYEVDFKPKQKAHREEYKRLHGHHPGPGSYEDYTVANFFQETYRHCIDAGVIYSGYLQRTDDKLYRALLDHVRGSSLGRCGRKPTTLEELGLLTIEIACCNALQRQNK